MPYSAHVGIFAAALFLSAISLPAADADDAAPPDPTKEATPNKLGGMKRVPEWARDGAEVAKRMPIIDSFGQFRPGTWPGKVLKVQDFASQMTEEATDLAAHPQPAGWDKWGGWADGPQLKATGRFRTQKVDGRWWIVDPDGHVFFSIGVCGVRFGDATIITGREGWFEDAPWLRDPIAKAELTPFLRNRDGKPVDPAKAKKAFNFFKNNVRLKHGGPDWRQAHARLAATRLRSWGFNTIGNWSDEEIYLLRKTPYTVDIKFAWTGLGGSQGYWGPLPDPFDPSFKSGLEQTLAAQKGKALGDPWCLGLFVGNEHQWSGRNAEETIKSPPTQAAKLAFRDRLKAQYGSVSALNAAWGTTFADWETFLSSTAVPKAEGAKADLAAFTAHYIETYFRTVRDGIKAADPGALYLGCRFCMAWTDAGTQRIAAKYCDILSYNLYGSYSKTPGAIKDLDVPAMCTEFHQGMNSRELPRDGLSKKSAGPEGRAGFLQNYIEKTAADPRWVGVHWFLWADQPATGRGLDGENYQIGLVDVTDVPYDDLRSGARAAANVLYQPEKH